MKSIVFIGAGRGVIPLMEYLTSKSNIAVIGIVDEDKDAPGIVRAKQLNVPIGSDVREFLSGKIDLIINSTGSKEIGDSVSLMGRSDVEIIGGGGTELLCDLIEEAERSRQRVRLQTSILEQVSNAVIVSWHQWRGVLHEPICRETVSMEDPRCRWETYLLHYASGKQKDRRRGIAVCNIF